ncbi:phage tail protein [Staphylococcus chromogenes]|uniref:phage tail protein n=1 Tax=Staphylococcus chromogenes TaxID=46126 RepID=UPI000D198A14|nr:phage tail protein [Staphylococcus chromogenes]PTG23379.1 hypothetical protein BU642_03995 [Staphylococcus chromogenes]PTG95748.1 hypothetical protein BU632_07310 [Staphylococcus chromogenes]
MANLGASMYLRDLNGDEYMMEGEVKHSQEINGDERIDVEIEYTEVNAHFLRKNSDLKMWILGFETKEYRIISSTIKGHGDKYTVSVTGILYMLDWLNSNRIYQRIDASLTTVEAMNLIFDDSPFTYQITAQAPSKRFEGLGDGETRLEMLKKFIEGYGFEITILGNVMYFQALIGNDTNFQYEYKVNATDITQETDASEMFTYAEGYGDYPDDDESAVSKAKLKRSYVSPLESIVGHRRHAPPIKDGRITIKETMDAALKKLVDDSLQISFSANLNDLKHRGYKYEHAKLGDRIFLVDRRSGLDTEIRVVKIDRSYTQEYELKDISITFGSKNMADTYTSNFSSAVSNINDVMAGRKAIPFEALGIITQSMVTKIQNTSSELSFDINGIHAIDKNNANNIVTLNSSGMYLSTDGGRTGKTAITAEGITASAITTGEMLANRIRGGTLEAINGYSQWNMNTGSMYFFGDSLVRFYSMYNQIVQSTQTGSYSSGLSFETQSNPDGMLAYFGTSAGGTLNPRRNEYAGLTVRSDNRTTLLTGDKIMFSYGRITNTVNAPTWSMDGVWNTTTSEQYFYGNDPSTHNYHLGKPSNPFKSLYVAGIGAPSAAVGYAYFDKIFGNTLNKFELKEFGGAPTLMYGATGIQFNGANGIFVINSQGQQLAKIWGL